MEWWLWVALGLVVLGIELFTPSGFFLLFFGVAALVTGALAAIGLGGSLALQVLLFTVLSVAGILLFRRALVVRFARGGALREIDSLVGETAVAVETLAPGALGRVELRGSTWTARNGGGVRVERGHRCTVERVDGLTLWVRIAADEYLAETLPAGEPETPVSSGASPDLSPGEREETTAKEVRT